MTSLRHSLLAFPAIAGSTATSQAQTAAVPPGGDPALACKQRPNGRAYWTEYGFCDLPVKGPSQAKGLVGRIAFDSFKRVRQSFYDLVLKADVGVVDVAFTRKQDKTQEIQKLAQQKDRELKQLDEEFKEVLKDVD